ncbi:MAG: AI-2E family transporter [Gemmatimonadetes bacterium]|nr:AI-2E family transporter [Gemmatimonadota bacterium]
MWTAVIIYGVSFFQSQVVSPVLASERMNMPAILILLGQIIFGFFFGFLGLMLAVPLSACVAVLIDEMYVKDVLGDQRKASGEAEEPV